jgi:hypothetical protein
MQEYNDNCEKKEWSCQSCVQGVAKPTMPNNEENKTEEE